MDPEEVFKDMVTKTNDIFIAGKAINMLRLDRAFIKVGDEIYGDDSVISIDLRFNLANAIIGVEGYEEALEIADFVLRLLDESDECYFDNLIGFTRIKAHALSYLDRTDEAYREAKLFAELAQKERKKDRVQGLSNLYDSIHIFERIAGYEDAIETTSELKRLYFSPDSREKLGFDRLDIGFSIFFNFLLLGQEDAIKKGEDWSLMVEKLYGPEDPNTKSAKVYYGAALILEGGQKKGTIYLKKRVP